MGKLHDSILKTGVCHLYISDISVISSRRLRHHLIGSGFAGPAVAPRCRGPVQEGEERVQMPRDSGRLGATRAERRRPFGGLKGRSASWSLGCESRGIPRKAGDFALQDLWRWTLMEDHEGPLSLTIFLGKPRMRRNLGRTSKCS